LNSPFPRSFNEPEKKESSQIATLVYDRYSLSNNQICATTTEGTTVPVTTQMIFGHKAEVLWDSGASVTLISLPFLRELIKKNVPIRMAVVKKAPTFTCANKSKVSPKGFATFKLDIDADHSINIGCWVLESMPHDIIIGSDTFRRTKA
jgi:hypothetical protein